MRLPEFSAEVKPERPWVLYEFAIRRFQELSAGQRVLLRMSADQRQRVKRVLTALRLKLVAAPRRSRAPPSHADLLGDARRRPVLQPVVALEAMHLAEIGAETSRAERHEAQPLVERLRAPVVGQRVDQHMVTDGSRKQRCSASRIIAVP